MRKGLAQTTLAHYAGVGIKYVCNLENGKETTELGKAIHVLEALGANLVEESREFAHRFLKALRMSGSGIGTG